MVDRQRRTHLRAGVLSPDGQQQLVVQLQKRKQLGRRQGHRLQNGQTTGLVVQREVFEELLLEMIEGEDHPSVVALVRVRRLDANQFADERLVQVDLRQIRAEFRRIVVHVEHLDVHFHPRLLELLVGGDDDQLIVPIACLAVQRAVANSQTEIVAEVLIEFELFVTFAEQLIDDLVRLGQIFVLHGRDSVTLPMQNIRVLRDF